jgi:hypothetical protein
MSIDGKTIETLQLNNIHEDRVGTKPGDGDQQLYATCVFRENADVVLPGENCSKALSISGICGPKDDADIVALHRHQQRAMPASKFPAEAWHRWPYKRRSRAESYPPEFGVLTIVSEEARLMSHAAMNRLSNSTGLK